MDQLSIVLQTANYFERQNHYNKVRLCKLYIKNLKIINNLQRYQLKNEEKLL